MGMAASQARYLALNARMNDIEYQGQQINQQRTTLSSQVNALYNSLLEMDVPTPPSTSDYTKIQYTGSLNASSFTIKNITPTSDGLYSVKLDYKESGNIVNKSYKTAKVVSTPAEFPVTPASSDITITDLFKEPSKTGYSLHDNYERGEIQEDDGESNVLLKVSQEQAKEILSNDGAAPHQIYTKDKSGNCYQVDNLEQIQDNEIYIFCNANEIKEGTGELYEYVIIVQQAEGETEIDQYTNAFKCEDATWQNTKESLSDDEISSLLQKNLLIKTSNGTGRPLTAKDIDDYKNNLDELLGVLYKIEQSSKTTLPNANAGKTDYSIQDAEGNTIASLYTLTAAVDAGLITEDGYKEAMNSLRHSFSDLTDSEILKKFLVYIDKEGVPTFIKRDDLGKITDKNSTYVNYYQMGAGTYSTTKDYEGCKLEFDNQGRVTTIFIKDGDQTYSVKLEAETVTDSEAYEDAYNDYEYQKYLYDKKQQEINAKTSIIQSEDKNLELKLTRLDNERNAVNTELEAVKKVIDDDIDKSFKTFSG